MKPLPRWVLVPVVLLALGLADRPLPAQPLPEARPLGEIAAAHRLEGEPVFEANGPSRSMVLEIA